MEGYTSGVNTSTVQAELVAIEERYGPWIAHNIDLGNGTLTRPEEPLPDLSTVIKLAADVARKPIAECRVVDLGCLEGMFALAFAKAGAEVVGIEGRERNIEKARFATRVVEQNNIEFIQADVRGLSSETYGKFDIVFCQGVLYHLDVPDVFTLIEKMKEVCRAAVIINTHFAPAHIENSTFELGSLETVEYGGNKYSGRYFVEHSEEDTREVVESRVLASLDNCRSFWLTKASLLAALEKAGFRHIYICRTYYLTSDRFTVVATVE
jgi:SAM-dependent methyltransferase